MAYILKNDCVMETKRKEIIVRTDKKKRNEKEINKVSWKRR